MTGEKRQPIFDNVYELFPGVMAQNLSRIELDVLAIPAPNKDTLANPPVPTPVEAAPRPPYSPENWDEYKECVGKQRLFWSSKPKDVKAAKQICASCIARIECLEDALERDDLGVQAGHTQKERQRIREQRRWINS